MKQCFGYVRVSTQKQGEGVSLEAQREAIEQFASRNEITISQWFEEKQTAAKGGRPVFGAMLKALRKGEAAGVVMHKIDRSARNFADWAKIGDLSDAGIDVHFASESLDFRSRGGRLSADIQAVIAADYIRNLRDECLKGIRGRLKQGLCPWGAPLGYLNNGKGKPKTPDQARAPLIKELFELYASGTHSMRSLQAEMARRGLRNSRGKPLSKSSVEHILGNPFYCGILKVKSTGDSYEGCHEPLISLALFDAVQAVKAGKFGKRFTRHNHTYRGLFRCAGCRAAMIPERQKGHVYYRCQTHNCRTTTVREEAIDTAILGELALVSFSDRQIARIEEAFAAWADAAPTEPLLRSIQIQVSAIEERLERLTDALIDRLIDADVFKAKKEALLLERKRLREESDKLTQDQSRPGDLRKFLELIKNLAPLYVSVAAPEKRQIVELTTSNRVVAGRSISLEPQKWLVAARALTAVQSGPPHRPTSRMSKQHLAAILEGSRPNSCQTHDHELVCSGPDSVSSNRHEMRNGQMTALLEASRSTKADALRALMSNVPCQIGLPG